MSFLEGIKFSIISDRDGDFSRAFGVLKLKDGQFGAARAQVILDQEGKMVHRSLHRFRLEANKPTTLPLRCKQFRRAKRANKKEGEGTGNSDEPKKGG